MGGQEKKNNFLSVFCVAAAGFVAAMATHHMMRCIRLLCAEREGENEHSSLLKVKVTLEFLPESWGRSDAPVPSACCAQREGVGARGGIELQNQVRYNCFD